MKKIIIVFIIFDNNLRIVIMDEYQNILFQNIEEIAFNKKLCNYLCEKITLFQTKYPNSLLDIVVSLHDLEVNKSFVKLIDSKIFNKFQLKPYLLSIEMLTLYSVKEVLNRPVIVISSFDRCFIIGKNHHQIKASFGYGNPFLICCYESLLSDRISELIKCFESGKKLTPSDQEILKLFEAKTVQELVFSYQNKSKNDLIKLARKLEYDEVNLKILKKYGRLIAKGIQKMLEELSINEQYILAFKGEFLENNRFLKNIILNNLAVMMRKNPHQKVLNYRQITKLESKYQDIIKGVNFVVFNNDIGKNHLIK